MPSNPVAPGLAHQTLSILNFKMATIGMFSQLSQLDLGSVFDQPRHFGVNSGSQGQTQKRDKTGIIQLIRGALLGVLGCEIFR